MKAAKPVVYASLLSALVAVTTACKEEQPPTPTPTTEAAAPATAPADQLETNTATARTYSEGIPGSTVTAVETLNATVIEIDREKRLAVLQDEAGNRRQVHVPAAMVNFDQVQVGDRVNVAAAVETIVSVQEPGSASDQQSGLAAQAAEGQEPGLFVAESTQVTAIIESIDETQRTATLKFGDGSTRTVRVRDDIVMSPDYLGKEVVINITAAVAASIEKVGVAPAD